MKFDRLLEPITIHGLTLPNRMVMPAMVTNYCGRDGLATEKFVAYHERRARGGWGLQITEDYAISEFAGGYVGLPGLWKDEQIPSHAAFVKRIHEAGGRICAQIYHAGREAIGEEIFGVKPVAPSPIKDPTMAETPRELTIYEIEQIVSDFADCARRVKECGFDAVEVHGAHGYLITQFLSPFSNKRSDRYGGTVENRARFGVEVVAAVREAVGSDYPILFRMSTQEYVTGGITLVDTKVAAQMLEEVGVDCFHCAQGNYPTQYVIVPPFYTEKAAYVDNAAAIKSVVSVPVIGVGKINDPFVADTVLREGKCDLVTMGRASIADPEFPNKVAEGRQCEIRRCIGCVQGCVGENFKGVPIRCTLDPLTGAEDEYDLSAAETPKRVLVVGGGVAGCECAIVAAKRGHEVTLVERSPRLGGQWNQAATAIGKGDFSGFIGWQSLMLDKYGVDVRLNMPCTQLLLDADWEVVVDATGSVPFVPPIKGLIDIDYLTAVDILGDGVVPTGTVAVIGAGLSGSEIAEHLAVHGTTCVHLIEMLDTIAADGVFPVVNYLKKSLAEHDVNVHLGSRVIEAAEGSIVYEDSSGQHVLDGLDAIVLASGVKSTHTLDGFDFGKAEVLAVGDAASPKDGYHNIREGFEIGLRI